MSIPFLRVSESYKTGSTVLIVVQILDWLNRTGVSGTTQVICDTLRSKDPSEGTVTQKNPTGRGSDRYDLFLRNKRIRGTRVFGTELEPNWSNFRFYSSLFRSYVSDHTSSCSGSSTSRSASGPRFDPLGHSPSSSTFDSPLPVLSVPCPGPVCWTYTNPRQRPVSGWVFVTDGLSVQKKSPLPFWLVG